jgi:hypothetical protein
MAIKKILLKIPFVIYVYTKIIKFKNAFVYLKEFNQFKSQSNPERFDIKWKNRKAILSEKTITTEFDRHYVYHTSWAARCLAETKPDKHIDISSSLFFSGICSSFINIEFYDYRPANLILSNLYCGSANLTKLHFKDNSIQSLSCMHTVEHIGLGRYGDEINPNGDLEAIAELQRVLAPNGNLFFVVPVGKPTIMFNAHRIYSYNQIISYFKNLSLVKFTLIGQNFSDGGLVDNPSEELLNSQTYGCGCFWFKKA